MKLSLRDKAGIAALWGTIFLFLLPISVGIWAMESGLQGGMAVTALLLGCLISALIGVVYFWQAVTLLTLYSKAQVAAQTSDHSHSKPSS